MTRRAAVTAAGTGTAPATPVLWGPPVNPLGRPWLTDIEVVLGSEERPDLLRWSGLFPDRPGTRDSYAARTADGLVFIDPADAAPEAAERLGALLARMGGSPVASVLTYVMHERAAPRIRARTGAAVWAPRGRPDVLESEANYVFCDGATLPGSIRAVTLEDMHTPPGPEGDSFLLWRAPTGECALFSYDRIIGRVLSVELPRFGGHVVTTRLVRQACCGGAPRSWWGSGSRARSGGAAGCTTPR